MIFHKILKIIPVNKINKLWLRVLFGTTFMTIAILLRRKNRRFFRGSSCHLIVRFYKYSTFLPNENVENTVQCADELIWDIFNRKRYNLKCKEIVILETSKWQNFNWLKQGSSKWNQWNKLLGANDSCQRLRFEGKSIKNML